MCFLTMNQTILDTAYKWNQQYFSAPNVYLNAFLRIRIDMHTLLCIFFSTSLIAELEKNPPAIRRPPFDSWVGKILWRWDRLPTPLFLSVPYGSDGKEFASNEEDLGSIPVLGRSLEKWMATNSSILAWGIPWAVWPTGLQRVRHHWVTFTFTCIR